MNFWKYQILENIEFLKILNFWKYQIFKNIKFPKISNFQNIKFMKISIFWKYQIYKIRNRQIRYPHFEQLSRITHKKCRKTAGTGVKLYLIVIFQRWNLLSWEIRQIPMFNPREGPIFGKSDPLGPGNGTWSEKKILEVSLSIYQAIMSHFLKNILHFWRKMSILKYHSFFLGPWRPNFKVPVVPK